MPGNKPSLIQKVRINQIRAAGGHVVIAYSVADAVQMLTHMIDSHYACDAGECLYTSAIDLEDERA